MQMTLDPASAGLQSKSEQVSDVKADLHCWLSCNQCLANHAIADQNLCQFTAS